LTARQSRVRGRGQRPPRGRFARFDVSGPLDPSRRVASIADGGTLVGFVAKYILDKNFIFFDAYSGHARETAKVRLCGLFSIVTTVVFWSFEAGFWAIWRTDLAKYNDAVLGPALGYAAKFLLDKRFTFRSAPA
jgi:hypothetical protein